MTPAARSMAWERPDQSLVFCSSHEDHRFPYRSYEITPRVRVWRQTLERCRSAAQVCLCMGQLERSIAWEKSVNKVVSLET